MVIYIVEVFSSFFLKNIGCNNFVPYDFAELGDEIGCISPSFIDKNVKYQPYFLDILTVEFEDQNLIKEDSQLNRMNDSNYINSLFDKFYEQFSDGCTGQYSLSVEFVCEKVTNFCKINNLQCDFLKLKSQLNKLVVYDYFMLNYDRGWQNLTILVKENNKKLTFEMAPIYDNGECFGMENFDRLPKDRKYDENYLAMGLSENGRIYDFSGNKLFENQNLIAVDIAEIAKNDHEIKKIVKNCVNLDITDLIDQFEKQFDIELPENYKEVIINCYNSQVKKFKTANANLNKKLNRDNIKDEYV